MMSIQAKGIFGASIIAVLNLSLPIHVRMPHRQPQLLSDNPQTLPSYPHLSQLSSSVSKHNNKKDLNYKL
jgi:hypothetical protein